MSMNNKTLKMEGFGGLRQGAKRATFLLQPQESMPEAAGLQFFYVMSGGKRRTATFYPQEMVLKVRQSNKVVKRYYIYNVEEVA